jgi:hypothetical protein
VPAPQLETAPRQQGGLLKECLTRNFWPLFWHLRARDVYVLKILRPGTLMLCTFTYCDVYVMLRYVM